MHLTVCELLGLSDRGQFHLLSADKRQLFIAITEDFGCFVSSQIDQQVVRKLKQLAANQVLVGDVCGGSDNNL